MTLGLMTGCKVEEAVVSIELVQAPDVVEYDLNAELKMDGARIEVIYIDGTKATLVVDASMFNADEVDMSTAGEKNVPITYSGKSVSVKITVIDLAAAKSAAIAELDGYQADKAYAQINQDAVDAAKASGQTAISGAVGSKQIQDALAAAKAAIDSIAPITATVTADLPETVTLLEPIEFTAEATDFMNAEGVSVTSAVIFGNPDAVLRLEVFNDVADTWDTVLPAGRSVSDENITAKDVSFRYRVAFGEVGAFDCRVELYPVNSEKVIASYDAGVTVAAGEVVSVGNEAELRAALERNDVPTVEFTNDIALSQNNITVGHSVNINGNGYTLSSEWDKSSNTGILSVANVAGVNLAITDLTIKAEKAVNGTVTATKAVGISFEKTTNCALSLYGVDISVMRYGVHSRTNDGLIAVIRNSNINGYGAYYSRASRNESVDIDGCELNGTAFYNGETNSFAAVSVQYGGGTGPSENVTIRISNSTVESGTKSDQDSYPFLIAGAGAGFENKNTRISLVNTKIIANGKQLSTSDYASAFVVKDYAEPSEEDSVTGLEITNDGERVNPEINRV